jgi:hypothetical protein
MIEMVTKEKFYNDSRHDPLRPAVPKDLMASHAGSFAAPSRTTRSGGASSASSTNNGFLKMFRGIFAMCQCMNQCLDLME